MFAVSLDGPYDIKCPLCPPMVADEIDVVLLHPYPADSPENYLSSLTLAASGLTEIQLSSAAVAVGGLYPQVTGDGVASAGGNQLTIGDLGTNGQDGFTVQHAAHQPACVRRAFPNLIAPRRATAWSMCVHRHRGSRGAVCCQQFPAWQQYSTHGTRWRGIQRRLLALGTTSQRIAIKQPGIKIAEITFTGNPHVPVLPTFWAVSADPAAPSVTLSWPELQTITVDGTNYIGDELQFIAVSPDLPLSAITGVQIRASGVDALTLSSLGAPPQVWVLQPPLITPSEMTIQWSGPAGGTSNPPRLCWGPGIRFRVRAATRLCLLRQ